MISFRYHVVSLIAVLLALTVGIVTGTALLNGPVLATVRGEAATAASERDTLRARVETLRGAVGRDEQFATGVADAAVAGKLRDRSVVLISAPDVDAALTSGLQTILTRAGAKVTGELQLLPGYVDPARQAELRGYATSDSLPAGIQLPESSDASVLGSALLATVLVRRSGGEVTAKDTAQVLAGLVDLRMLRVTGTSSPQGVVPAGLAVLVTAGHPRPEAVRAVTDLASALDQDGQGVVVAGDRAAADAAGPLAAIRGEKTLAAAVSTVDSVSGAAGRVAVVYALAEQLDGRAGQYGMAPNAVAALPGTGG